MDASNYWVTANAAVSQLIGWDYRGCACYWNHCGYTHWVAKRTCLPLTLYRTDCWVLLNWSLNTQNTSKIWKSSCAIECTNRFSKKCVLLKAEEMRSKLKCGCILKLGFVAVIQLHVQSILCNPELHCNVLTHESSINIEYFEPFIYILCNLTAVFGSAVSLVFCWGDYDNQDHLSCLWMLH